MVDTLRQIPQEIQIRARLEERMRRFVTTSENPDSDVAQMVKVGLSKEVAGPDLLREMSVISAVVLEGIPVAKDELGWREARLEDLNFAEMAREFGLQEGRLQQVAGFMVSVNAIKSTEKIAQAMRRPAPGETRSGSISPSLA